MKISLENKLFEMSSSQKEKVAIKIELNNKIKTKLYIKHYSLNQFFLIIINKIRRKAK